MRSALYYPHIQLSNRGVASQRLVKRALLLWDHLEFIVPSVKYRRREYSGRLEAEAIELVARKHVPNDREKQAAHGQIKQLVTRRPLPQVFYYRGSHPDYKVYEDKFPRDTWDLLSRFGLTGLLQPDRDYPVSPQTWLLMMGVLADCCAGTTLCRVTDLGQAYASLAGLLGEQSFEGAAREDATRSRLADKTVRVSRAPGHEYVVTMKLPLVDVDKLDLEKLVALRKREAKQTGHSLRDLRHRYVERIENQLKELTTNPKLTPADHEGLERQFEEDMRDDLAFLRDELRAESWQVVFSKEVLVTLLASVGTIAHALFSTPVPFPEVVTATGAVVTLGGLLATRSKFLKARGDILRKHPMAYLYELGEAGGIVF
jgi:hypothetical protein